MRYLLSWNRFVCWLSMWGCVPFWVEANTFTVWDWGDALPSKLIQFRLLIEYVGMRILLSRSRFVTYLNMWGGVSFWVEANTFTVWDWGIALPSEWKQIRLLIEYVGMRILLSRSRFVTYLNMWGGVSIWVEANTFTVWDWGYALPSELKQIRLLIEYAGIRSLLSRSKFVWWLSMCGCVPFWVEADSFDDWVCGVAFPFE